ncbi:maternally expressed PAB C-terminal protein-like [Raphanus sativus]|uniref:Maternally expressed PAB C-terminal protein-like n=1 Tax=Raphanus sativus TaxID=3726 RepID=A0A6J0NY52_RAPSA|nr:maternally expressed PAB C-terminal protein-like [Raphanus sativus]XP_056867380.1 maternally expressed PAB C-terminal protein-like [Raphanus sativus]
MPPFFSVYRFDDPLTCAAFRRFHVVALTAALENQTSSEQRTMIGETLYPLVELLEPLFTPEITGMLLELPRTQIFQCIESPEALKEKVNEAIVIIMDWFPKQMNLDELETMEFRAAMILSHL